jgi:hypothetical protein
MYDRFRPGRYWYDTEGKLIQAHGGSILFHNQKYYWYGENKEGVTGKALGQNCPIWQNGVRLYSSDDLYNWKDEGVILVDKENKESPFYPGQIMDRPHILYNEKTKKFVLWAKIAGLLGSNADFTKAYFAVCVADDIKGEYKLVNIINDMSAGDLDLVKDGDTAYVIFEKPHTEMICRQLNEDYTGVVGDASSHLARLYPPFVREAPAYFQRENRRFVLTSGTTGYYPNATETAEIIDFHGEWKDLGKTCEGDAQNNSFHAQFSSVFKHPFIKDLYIALGDRWLTDLPPQMPSPDLVFESYFNPEIKEKHYNLSQYSDENTSLATYVWLPIRFKEDGTPYIQWEHEWKIEDFINKTR